MDINEIIIAAVSPIVGVCVPDFYRPDAEAEPVDTYCVFNYTEFSDNFGDDEPGAVRYSCQLHLYLPVGVSPIGLKRRLRRAVLDMGGAVSDFLDASDRDGQHYVLEFEYTDGEVG